MPVDSPLDRSRHAAPQVFERLRELIISLELPPSTVLSRTELAARFGLSQTPVRDALIRLGEEGLVDIYPQHATVVSRINLRSATEALFLRRSIELEVVRELAERRDPTLLGALRETLDAQARLCDVKDYHRFSQLDQAFHHQMYEAAGVASLWSLVRRLSGHIDRLRRLHLPVAGKTLAVVKEHEVILAALQAGKVAAAQAAVREHLSGTLGRIEETRRTHAHFVTEG